MTPNVRRLNTRLPLAVAALALLVGATGCGGGTEAPASATEDAGVTTAWVDLPDGRVVLCVITSRWTGSGESGIDCDWATAVREGE